jgi:hypothetical protein
MNVIPLMRIVGQMKPRPTIVRQLPLPPIARVPMETQFARRIPNVTNSWYIAVTVPRILSSIVSALAASPSSWEADLLRQAHLALVHRDDDAERADAEAADHAAHRVLDPLPVARDLDDQADDVDERDGHHGWTTADALRNAVIASTVRSISQRKSTY